MKWQNNKIISSSKCFHTIWSIEYTKLHLMKPIKTNSRFDKCLHFKLLCTLHCTLYSPSVTAATTKHLVSQNRNILSMLCSRFTNHHVSRLSSKSYFNNSYFNIMGNFRRKYSRKSSWKLFHFRQFKTSSLI